MLLDCKCSNLSIALYIYVEQQRHLLWSTEVSCIVCGAADCLQYSIRRKLFQCQIPGCQTRALVLAGAFGTNDQLSKADLWF